MTLDEERALLRRFEPILRFTKGELFYPMDVTRYVHQCSLWVQRPKDEAVCLIPQRQLTLEALAQPRSDDFNAVHFLKLTDPLNPAQLAFYTLQKNLEERGKKDDTFHAGLGRLARVGYTSRLVDALLSLSLFARGRVPGDSAAAAALVYHHLQGQTEGYCYHGRVIEQNGWIVLQYWFFYAFNNWRSGFYGANDHESDWEMICIYLSQSADGEIQPEWVAYASHDYTGDDLRRHWSDPEVNKIGEHPIVHVGAGSHASYYAAGEYLTEIELSGLTPLIIASDQLQRFWHNTLNQYRAQGTQLATDQTSNIFRVPFVDYARGDGLSIGPAQDKEWNDPVLLSPTPAWVSDYRGLWGLYTRDPFSGEDAPAGPMYNRDGTVRRAWYDPVGWAGLDKVPPRPQALQLAEQQQEKLESEQEQLTSKINIKSETLQGLGIQTTSMRGHPHLSELFKSYQEEIDTLSEEIDQLRAERTTNQALLVSLQQYITQLQLGIQSHLRTHIQRAHHPASDDNLRASRFAEIWAAASIGLTLIVLVLLILFNRDYLIFGIILITSLFTFIESSFRGQLINLVTSVTIGLAITAALIIFYEFFWPLVTMMIFLLGSYILWDNLREVWR